MFFDFEKLSMDQAAIDFVCRMSSWFEGETGSSAKSPC
jgi:hypothetical protein